MNRRSLSRIPLPLLLAVAAVLILFLARRPASPATSVDLQLRVEPGAGAAVPTELAALMNTWPDHPAPADDEVELGWLLFFDPLLSGDQTVSCASCHHPDLGFGDGRSHAIGISQEPLRRHTPSLWNVSYRAAFNWDGRAASLQRQMLDGPLFDEHEMGGTPEQLEAAVSRNDTYRALFKSTYGELNTDRVADAIAAFLSTLVSQDAPFDRYAEGDFYALTGAQRRGFELFRSERFNCIACHELPTFRSDEFKIVGVRDDVGIFDEGGGISGDSALVGAFTVPTLRNVALHPPYMHNGTEPRLNNVISFYLNGGGDNTAIPRHRLSSELRPFSATSRELEDLEAFLYALTDESNVPEIPATLPSGLSSVQPLENPERALVAATNAYPPGEEPRTHAVANGESIQDAIDRARPGDTVVIAPGRYYESLEIDVERLTLEGEGATLVGRPFTPTGIRIRHNDLRLRGLTIESFPENTLWLDGARNVMLENVTLNGETVSGPLEELAAE